MKYLKRRSKKVIFTMYAPVSGLQKGDTPCCGTCEYFDMKMVCYGGSPFEVCECRRGHTDVSEDHEVCWEYLQGSRLI